MRRGGAALLSLAHALIAFAPANAAPVIVAPPYGAAVGFATPEVVAIRGLPVVLVNSDTIVHNVESIDVGPDDNPWCATYEFPPGSCPLFRSDDLGVGGTGEVFGVAALEEGRVYAFVCSYHGRMRGNLRVPAP